MKLFRSTKTNIRIQLSTILNLISLYFIKDLAKTKEFNDYTHSFSFGRQTDISDFLDEISDKHHISRLDLSESSPIFILSSGWRTGSTLVQRLVMSDPNVLIWGEPYSDTRPIPTLLSQIRSFRPGYPNVNSYEKIDLYSRDELVNQWIAYLFPSVKALYQSHHNFFKDLFEKEALERGYSRWGVKDVRLDIYHAQYLQWLFPNAKFVFLIRNPLDCWKSYKGFDWHIHWPHLQVKTVVEFATYWNYLADGFISHYNSVDSLLVKYEDLIDPNSNTIERVQDFLDVKIDKSLLNSRIPAPPKKQNETISWIDKKVIQLICSDVCHKVGYLLQT